MTRKKARILVMLFTVVCLLSVTCLCFAETPSILRYKPYIENYGLSWNIWGYGRLSR